MAVAPPLLMRIGQMRFDRGPVKAPTRATLSRGWAGVRLKRVWTVPMKPAGIWQVVPASAPGQPRKPAKTEPEAAEACKVAAPLKMAPQMPGQLMPLGLLVTLPVPVPVS